MKNNRLLTAAVLVGVIIVAVTFLGAARMSGDDGKPPKDVQKILAPVKTGSNGVVVFGSIGVDNGIDLLQLYPDAFPQPCKVIRISERAREGVDVKKGEVLVEFDPELADLKIAEAKAGLEKATAGLQGAEDQLKQAQQGEGVQQIGIKAQKLLLESKEAELSAKKIELNNKKERLGLVNAPNDPEVLAAEKNLEAAQKALEAERKKLEGLNNFQLLTLKQGEAVAQVAAAKATLAIQDAQLKQAEYAKKLLTLSAPSDGRIVRSLVTEGLVFGAQTRQPAFLFQPKGPLIVRAEVDQEFASRVFRGQDAIIQDEGNANLKWTGKVVRLSDGFLPKRISSSGPDGLLLNDARVLECIVSIESGDSNFPVRVGQRVKVSIGVE